jgi:hypothetical protein
MGIGDRQELIIDCSGENRVMYKDPPGCHNITIEYLINNSNFITILSLYSKYAPTLKWFPYIAFNR